MNFRVVIDVPSRFSRSRTVGAHLGLTQNATNRAKSTGPGEYPKLAMP
jgi:hypothetical protein